jgi:hypothetical protein
MKLVDALSPTAGDAGVASTGIVSTPSGVTDPTGDAGVIGPVTPPIPGRVTCPPPPGATSSMAIRVMLDPSFADRVDQPFA